MRELKNMWTMVVLASVVALIVVVGGSAEQSALMILKRAVPELVLIAVGMMSMRRLDLEILMDDYRRRKYQSMR